MPDPLADAITHPAPTRDRPLLGRTILAVEDSRYASDALRLMCQASGARLRRADCLSSARRHLRVYRPSVVIVDMGLPDGSGADLIAELAGAEAGLPSLAISGDPDQRAPAEASGCHGFLEKPIAGLGAFQQAVLACLPLDQRPRGPRTLDRPGEAPLTPDPLALRDDLTEIAGLLLLEEASRADLAYAVQFLRGLAQSAGDTELSLGVSALGRALAGQASGMIAAKRRLNALLRARICHPDAAVFGGLKRRVGGDAHKAGQIA